MAFYNIHYDIAKCICFYMVFGQMHDYMVKHHIKSIWFSTIYTIKLSNTIGFLIWFSEAFKK